ncbi:hypothetical protein B9479_007125 [Cryptococcus floricola]|uniref:TIGR02453 family protein n=1 Tax=Cryptococcus floricola TaxID=2591691 RepID=A0A5D3ANA0_9TREE|nr:hypothetical protein B9479_007125 [Cryptococcus floricola]
MVKPKSARSSARSTPVKKDTPSISTPTSTRSGRTVTKLGTTTSPYFANGKSKGRSTKKVDKDDEDDDEGLAEPTGMTSSEEGSSDDSGSEDDFGPSEDESEEGEAEPEESSGSEMDSDHIDDEKPKSKSKKKRKASSPKASSAKKAKTQGHTSKKTSNAGVKKAEEQGREYIEGYDDEDEDADFSDSDLEEGQELAGRIYPAPKTGQVAAGEISKNTLNFLKNLQLPERNDREWFKSHEPAFRQAEKEWTTFVTTMQMKLHEIDDEIPILPPRDIIHRIYRDVRFSSDKTPYKKGFSFTTSRGGRKGSPWAAYHLYLSPNGKSILAGGLWCPDKDQTAKIRHEFVTNPERFRKVIGEEEFEKSFGKATPPGKGEDQRRSVYGRDDQLKVAPKGVDKGHKDIDLLKLRTVAVVHYFTDEQVLEPTFQDTVREVARTMVPFIRLLNDYLT